MNRDLSDALGDLRRALHLAGANEPVRLVVPRSVALAFVREGVKNGVRPRRREDCPSSFVCRMWGIEVVLDEKEDA